MAQSYQRPGYRAIAERLGIGARTVQAQRARIGGKLHLDGIAAMVEYALKEGSISLDG